MPSVSVALPTATVDWVPLRAGVSMRPLHFDADGYALQLRVEPGTTIARHRHTGRVHALTVSGYREIVDSGEIVGPGDFVHEPAGNVDTWRCYGDEACVVHITIAGRVEYLDDSGNVTSHSDRDTAFAAYERHCAERDVPVDPRIAGSREERAGV